METHEVFETLLRDLRQALQDVQAANAQAIQEGRFEDARRVLRRAEDIHASIKLLEALQREWPALLRSAKGSRPRGPRLPRGQKTSGDVYRLPILATLDEMGGRASVQQVLDRVEQMVGERLNEADREVLSDGRSVRWRNTAQWERWHMAQEGLLASDSPRGVWEITEAGRTYLRQHQAEPSK